MWPRDGTVLTVSSRAMLAACERLGIDTDAIVRAVGIPRQKLDDPDARLQNAEAAAFWAKAYELSGDPVLSLHAAEACPIGAYKVIDYMGASARTVGQPDIALAEIAYLLGFADQRLSTLMAGWRKEVEPPLLAKARAASAPGARIAGKHPDAARPLLPIDAELTWLPIDALGLRASLGVSGGNYHGAERVYGVDDPQMNYSAIAADLGARWFILPSLHLTVHGGYTLYRRFEFSRGRDPAPGGEYELKNGTVFGIDLGGGG